VQSSAIISRISTREACGDESMVGRAPFLFSVIMGTRRSIQQTQPIPKCIETSEGISDATTKPANHSSADTAQNNSFHPRTPNRLVYTMHAPNRQQVCRISAAYIDDVLFG
jgi:hypothetical protein